MLTTHGGFVNDELVSNEPMALGTFTHEWPIGGYLQPGSTSLTVSIRAWFTWDSTAPPHGIETDAGHVSSRLRHPIRRGPVL